MKQIKNIVRTAPGTLARHCRGPGAASLLHPLIATQQKVAPRNTLGKAVNYTIKYWTELSSYINNGAWPIDNNPAENAPVCDRAQSL